MSGWTGGSRSTTNIGNPETGCLNAAMFGDVIEALQQVMHFAQEPA